MKKQTAKNSFSPMMQHYLQLKEQYPDAIVLYRLGDFYEMFFEDAKIASEILELTLTGRDCGMEERAPMCGVPYHAVDAYLSKLVAAGKKVAICEQLTNPGDQKGLVKRDVVRVVTPGTIVEDDMLQKEKNNYILSVFYSAQAVGIAYLDMNAGEIMLYSLKKHEIENKLEDFLLSVSPSEIISNSAFLDAAQKFTSFNASKLPKPSSYYDYAFVEESAKEALLKQIGAFSLQSLGLTKEDLPSVCAAGALCDYIQLTQKRLLSHINRIKAIRPNSTMILDYNTKRNLELTENIADRGKVGTLLWVIDETKTGMGARRLRRMLDEPLLLESEINYRLTAVEELFKSAKLREGVALAFQNVRDLERLTGKISYGNANPRDLLSISETLEKIPTFLKMLENVKSPLLKSLREQLDPMSDIHDLLSRAIDPKAPVNIKDGKIIKEGFHSDLDSLIHAKDEGANWLSEYEAHERERTGIRNLKVHYNRVFGYYIEVSNSYLTLVPLEYVRKQTISNGERYITSELKKMEELVLGAEEKALNLEIEIFNKILQKVAESIKPLQANADALSFLDALNSLALVAVKYGYVKPVVSDKLKKISIKDGRHPVVEAFKKKNEFVPNDTDLSPESNTLIITGPNMAGKSTYMRQVALIVLLAHVGSFVPANKAEISPVDRVFTRVGASDNLSQGQSTFMVEMIEVASILNNATEKSLLILDEIGRGTSTLDGLSIAWAIVEYLVANIKAKTLFATHYHELSELESLLPGVKNYRILIHEGADKITFLYKIARGGANKSFGIEVAELAGIRKNVTDRARIIMKNLEEQHTLSGGLTDKLSVNPTESALVADQLGFFSEDPKLTELKKVLKELDLNRITPIESLTILSDLKKIAETK